MVDIAQLVSASDCGSEGRGFESHYPPHKKYRYPQGYRYFLLIMGFERSIATVRWTVACEGLTEQHHNFRQGRKCKRIPLSVYVQLHVFRPWENPFLSGCASQEVWTGRSNDTFSPWKKCKRIPLSIYVQLHVARPWENPIISRELLIDENPHPIGWGLFFYVPFFSITEYQHTPPNIRAPPMI